MSRIQIELTETDVKALIVKHFEDLMGNVSIGRDNVTIEVKSKQNYKSEWETAALRANVVVSTI